MQFPDSDFWDFSIDYYKNSGVEKSCLKLQDHYSLNVNLILFCFWLGQKNKVKLEADQWRQLITISLPWEDIVTSLRKSRRILKQSPVALPADFKQETSEGVSKIELNTEHMQQLSLEQEWRKMPYTSSDDSIENIIRHNIKNYLKATQHNITPEDIEKDLQILLNHISLS